MVTMVGYEATLLAARELVEAGPFWLLDLWAQSTAKGGNRAAKIINLAQIHTRRDGQP
jgi:hypothetical protein